VITAYSAQDAIEILIRFPNVDGIVLDTEVHGMPCNQLIAALLKIRSGLPVITVSPSGHDPCGSEQYHVSSFDPQDLLEQLQSICSKETRKAAQEDGLHSGPQ
jgi:hypothetical protein